MFHVKRRSYALIAVMALIGLWPVATPAVAASGDLVITVAGPHSGKNASLGEPLRNGAKMAVDEINKKGGVNGHRVKLVQIDDNNDPKTAAQKAQEIAANNKTLLVLGHRSSDTSLAADPIYQKAGIPVLTGSAAAPDVTHGNPWSFRVISGADYQGRFLAQYIAKVQHLKKARIVADESAYGRTLAEAFKATATSLGVTVTGTWTATKADAADIGKQVASADKEGMILLSGEEDMAADVLRSIRDSGDTSPVYGGQTMGNTIFNDHFKNLPAEKENPGFYTDGVLATTIALRDTGTEAARLFYRRYKDIFGQTGQTMAAAYYDATMLALRGLTETKATGTNLAKERKALRDWLAAVDSPKNQFVGTTGRLYFDADRSAVKSVSIGRFSHSRFLAAPIQLEPIFKPDNVPNFATDLKAGHIIKIGDQYMSKVQVVYVGMDINAIPDINQRTGEFSADLFLWLRYQGESPAHDLEFGNATKPIDLGKPIWVRQKGDMTLETYRVRGNFSTDFNYANYPLDKQTLPIIIRQASKTTNSCVLATDTLGMVMKDQPFMQFSLDKLKASFASSNWKPSTSLLFQSSFKSDSTLGEFGLANYEMGLEYSSITAAIEVRRDVTSYLIKNLLPLALIILVLYISNFIAHDQLAVRANIGITGLLTSMVLFQRLSSDLPPIGYLILIDYGFFIAFGLSMTQVALAAFGYRAHKQGDEKAMRLINALGLSAIPVVTVTTLIVVIVQFVSKT